ncbi:MAG: SpoIVB peptidase [Clostridia bacterium]|nr:SpoIVB peptidase [Clostridia bacterium]
MKNIKIKGRGSRALTLVLCAAMMLTLLSGVFAVGATAANKDVYRYGDLKLVAGGIPFGVKFSTQGVIVIGFSEIEGMSKTLNPAYAAGLRAKDVIVEIDGKAIGGASDLTRAIEQSGGRELAVTYMRNGERTVVKMKPLYSRTEGKYKTGMWVKDSGAGIGTVTYIDPTTCKFAGLGHGICDGETGELIPMTCGDVMNVRINAIKKGIAGAPGEVKGYFGAEKTGRLLSNTSCGVYGVFDKLPDSLGEALPVGSRHDVKLGEAEIICTLDDGVRRTYKIEISTVNRDETGSKCFIIKVTDPTLIEKTGGIVQGMSGSPIIQNGKLVGAVTHVMINDPTVGYGIFIENMLDRMGDLLG